MTISTDVRPLQGAQIGRLPFIRHGITRRVPGMGDADGNISYSEPRDPIDCLGDAPVLVRANGHRSQRRW